MSQFEVSKFNPVFNQLHGDEGGFKAKLAAGVALVSVSVAGGVFATIYLSDGPEQKIQEDMTVAQGSVVSEKAAKLDCEPLIESGVSFKTGTKLELPNWLASTIRIDTIPYSGFTSSIRDETAKEFVKTPDGNDTDTPTKGLYETLGCLPKSKVKVTDDLDNMTRQIEMDQTRMQLFTREVADQTTLVIESPALSSAGEILSKLSRFGSFGKFEKFENYVEETKAKVGATTKQMAENFVERECFAAAFESTKKVVNLGLIEQAKADGFTLAPEDIRWSGVKPTFSGPYKLDGENGSYEVKADEYAVSSCEVDRDLLDAANKVKIENTTPNSTIRMEQ